MIKDIFNSEVVTEIESRFNQLSEKSTPLWGKMNVGQMLAHCSVTYEMIYENKYPKPGKIKQWLLRILIKPIVTGEKTYPKSSRTAPEFIITNQKLFDAEKKRLIDFIHKTQSLGRNYFEGKASHSFGPLTATEWNNMMYKHLDHHLQQFGV